MYYIAICDDDIKFIRYIKNMLCYAGVPTDSCVFLEFNSEKNFLNSLNDINSIDLLILDMQLTELNGNEVARQFRKHFPYSVLVFCSGVCMPTVESFEPNPYRYLLKEYTNEKIIQELKIVFDEVKTRKTEPTITGSWHHNTISLKPDDILYISICRGCSQIHINPNTIKCDYKDKIISKQKLSNIYQILKKFDFEYAHNSYIVNLRYIKKTSPTELELIDGTLLSIARSKEKNLRLAFATYAARKY